MLRRMLLLLAVFATLTTQSNATTGDTLLTDLRIKLGQTTASNSNWTDAQLYRCLNMGQTYISALGRAIEKLATLAGGSLRITAPTDFVTLKDNAYLWRNGGEVKPIPRVSADSLYKVMDRMTTQSFGVDKYVIAEDGAQIMVAPALNAADSVVVAYYANPAVIATGVECDLSDEWEQVLLEAAKVVALEKIGSPLLPMAIQERDKLIQAMYQSRTLRPQLGQGGQ